MLTDKDAILQRWTEHFDTVRHHVSMMMLSTDSQIECSVLQDEFPTVLETRKAVQQLSSGKDLGADTIPAEACMAVGLPTAEKLVELCYV